MLSNAPDWAPPLPRKSNSRETGSIVSTTPTMVAVCCVLTDGPHEATASDTLEICKKTRRCMFAPVPLNAHDFMMMSYFESETNPQFLFWQAWSDLWNDNLRSQTG